MTGAESIWSGFGTWSRLTSPILSAGLILSCPILVNSDFRPSQCTLTISWNAVTCSVSPFFEKLYQNFSFDSHSSIQLLRAISIVDVVYFLQATWENASVLYLSTAVFFLFKLPFCEFTAYLLFNFPRRGKCQESEITVESSEFPNGQWRFALLDLANTHYASICTENFNEGEA